MRRLLLVLTLTALFVASAVASGSALAQGVCEGLTNALEAQTTQTLPPAAQPDGEMMPRSFPGQGDEHSAIDHDLFMKHHCQGPPPQ